MKCSFRRVGGRAFAPLALLLGVMCGPLISWGVSYRVLLNRGLTGATDPMTASHDEV